MATYFLFGKYSAESLRQISPDRTKKAVGVIEKFGGKVRTAYALLGDRDLVFIADLRGTEEAIQTSLALTKLTGISFSTTEAVSIDDFDKLAKEA